MSSDEKIKLKPPPSFSGASTTDGDEYDKTLSDIDSLRKREKKLIRSLKLVPHVYNLPVGFHIHCLLLIALQTLPDSVITEMFDNQNIKNYQPFLIAIQPTTVDFSEFLLLSMSTPPLRDFLNVRLQKNGFLDRNSIEKKIYQYPFFDYSNQMFESFSFFSTLMPYIDYVESYEQVVQRLESCFSKKFDPNLSLNLQCSSLPFFPLFPFAKIFIPWKSLKLDSFPDFYPTENFDSNCGFRRTFVIYTLNNFSYLALMTNPYPTDTPNEDVIICDGCSKIGSIPQDQPSFNIVFVGYVPTHYTKHIHVVNPRQSTPLHISHVKHDSLLKQRIEALSAINYNILNFKDFFKETLLNPFRFLLDCKFDSSSVYFGYLYFYTNYGTMSNAESLIQNLGGKIREISEKKVWDQYLFHQVFLLNVNSLFCAFYENDHSNIINNLVNVVSCAAVNNDHVYQFLLCTIKTAVAFVKENFPEAQLNDMFHYLVLDTVGNVRYNEFCLLLGMEPNKEICNVELNSNFLFQHLVHTFSVCSKKQKLYSFLYELDWCQDYWKKYIDQEFLDQIKVFRPPSPYLLYISRLKVSCPFFI